jgi:hypothetical protein
MKTFEIIVPVSLKAYEHMICKVDAETAEEALELAMQGEYYDTDYKEIETDYQNTYWDQVEVAEYYDDNQEGKNNEKV